jgi:hypothetical protein
MAPKTVLRDPKELRPHALNLQLYGPPTANSAYQDMRLDMKRRGYDETEPLMIAPDDRVLRGCTRHAAARSVGLAEVPCVVFYPSSPETAELEFERELIRGNSYRTKTEVMKAREQRKLLEVEAELARRRMGGGSDGGPSKSTDRVGKIFKESGKSVQRRLKVLAAIEAAEADGDARRAERLTDLLNGKKITKALALLDPARAKAPAVRHVEVPPTLHAHVNRMYSECYEACAKARVGAEVDVIEAMLARMREDAAAARRRVEG